MSRASAKVFKPYARELRGRAIDAFRERYPGLRFAPVVVVIAAYDEEEGLGAVLEGIPPNAWDMDIDTLVVDDGSHDRTSEVSFAHGVHVARLERNCGHGLALRLGYRLAREHGARYPERRKQPYETSAAQTVGRREQEGQRPAVRVPLRPRRAAHLVARAAIGRRTRATGGVSGGELRPPTGARCRPP